MLRLTATVLRQRGKAARQSKLFSSLPTPNLRRAWGNLSDLTTEEKKEILQGTWRDAKSIALVTDETERDRGGFTQPVAFTTDEDAAAFLAEESSDEASEQQIPSLQLARDFFQDLASTADEELDVAGGSPPVSDEARLDEERDVHRQFFADYYIPQGLIGEEERFAFVDAMLRPARAPFQVNSSLPLSRLVVRDQLEAHGRGCASTSGPTFLPTEDPLTYEVALMPTQPFGAAPRVPYTAERSVLSQRDAAAASTAAAALPTDGGTDPLLSSPPEVTDNDLNEADLLSAMLNDERPGLSQANEEVKEPHDAVSIAKPPQAQDSVLLATAKANSVDQTRHEHIVHALPPSVGHIQWLQRQVATGTLFTVDTLSRLLSVVAVHTALSSLLTDAAAADGGAHAPCIISSMSSTTEGSNQLSQQSSYHCDVAQYVGVAAAVYPSLASILRSIVVVRIAEPTARPSSSLSPRHDRQPMVGEEEERDDLSSAAVDAVPLLERAPALVYIQPQRHQTSSSERRGGRMCAPLRRACHVVLCTPRTTQDGVRPRVLLGDPDTTAEEAGAATPAPHRFVTLSTEASEHFPRLQRELRAALQYARCSESGGKSYVVYATSSMNPIENEAVVSSVLTGLLRPAEAAECADPSQQSAKGRDSEVHRKSSVAVDIQPVPLHVLASEMHHRGWEEECAMINHYIRSGGRTAGLSTWCAVKGGSQSRRWRGRVRASCAPSRTLPGDQTRCAVAQMAAFVLSCV